MDDYLAKPIRIDVLGEALRIASPLRDAVRPAATDGAAELDERALEGLKQLGGEDSVGDLIDAFRTEGATLVETLRRSIDTGDVVELRRAAHTLKSHGATFGAGALAEQCRELDECARCGQLTEAASLADRIDVEFRRVEQALDAWRVVATT
jgi:HPt (histidine-containing phosphotransfer) domain-containing protein